jgi:hypothetical protein
VDAVDARRRAERELRLRFSFSHRLTYGADGTAPVRAFD